MDNVGGPALRDHKWKLKVKRYRLQLRKYFSVRGRSVHGISFHNNVVDDSSVNSSKKRLDDWLADVDL